MRKNYIVMDGRGGVTQQLYEATTKIQRFGIPRLLEAAKVKPEGLIVHAACRNGDSTLGLAESTSESTRIIAVEEPRDVLLVAKVKWGLATPDEYSEVAKFLVDMPIGWIDKFQADSAQYQHRVSFVDSPIEQLPHAIGLGKANSVIGMHLLHAVNADETGMPAQEAIRAISETLAPGGVLVAGTTTSFVKIDPEQRVEGMTKAEYSVDLHPFFQIVYRNIANLMEGITGSKPSTPININPPIDLDLLQERFTEVGLTNFETGAFLVTVGQDIALTQQIRLRPAMQGRLNGVDDVATREYIVDSAIKMAHMECDLLVNLGKSDPRLNTTNIYDILIYVKAVKQ